MPFPYNLIEIEIEMSNADLPCSYSHSFGRLWVDLDISMAARFLLGISPPLTSP